MRTRVILREASGSAVCRLEALGQAVYLLAESAFKTDDARS
jgi:hypothetical protein